MRRHGREGRRGILASGYGETGAEGKKSRTRCWLARAAGMRIVGPNSQGLANFGNGAIANFSTVFNDLPRIPGPVAIISQKAARCRKLICSLLHQRGIGIRRFATPPATRPTSPWPSCALAAAQDPEVKLLLLYLRR